MSSAKELEEIKKKRPKEDILDIVKQFISYFEETDRSENNGNSSTSSKCF